MTTCIIRGSNDFWSSSFIRAHIEYLDDPKVVVDNYYRGLAHDGKTIRYFYRTHPLRQKLKTLLPQFLYHRCVTRYEDSYERMHDSLTAFFTQHNVDVILAEFGIHGSNIYRHARDSGIPLVVHFHGHDAHRDPLLAGYKERYREMFDYAYRIVSVSKFMTEKLIRMGADESKIVYNPYGPREEFYENQSEYTRTFLALGRFTDIKAPYLTLMAFKQVLETCPDARLVVGGDGELLETCKCLARTWKIESQVSFPGALRHEQVIPLLAKACCFVQHSVMPSYGDAEGTPVAILEAGAAGLPVVSTRHAGIRDAVIHGETGFLVEERDVDGMAEYMRKLVADQGLCRRMGAKARDHIRANYNIQRHIACIQELINAAKKQ